MGETLDGILAALRDEGGLERAWVGIGCDPAAETAAADTGDGRPPGPPGRYRVLQAYADDSFAPTDPVTAGPDGTLTVRMLAAGVIAVTALAAN